MPIPTTPALTVDIIIELHDRPERPVVLVERKHPPLGWAFPGGFVDVGESVGKAAVREAMEETCLDVTLDELLGCYSDPGRDSRGHTVSLVYVAHASGEPKAADDAADLVIANPFAVETNNEPVLVFDHANIMRDYCEFRRTGNKPLPE